MYIVADYINITSEKVMPNSLSVLVWYVMGVCLARAPRMVQFLISRES